MLGLASPRGEDPRVLGSSGRLRFHNKASKEMAMRERKGKIDWGLAWMTKRECLPASPPPP